MLKRNGKVAVFEGTKAGLGGKKKLTPLLGADRSDESENKKSRQAGQTKEGKKIKEKSSRVNTTNFYIRREVNTKNRL